MHVCRKTVNVIQNPFCEIFQGLAKSGKKGVKKKVVDPFTRKDWYDIKAPSVFKVRDVGKTLVNKTQGTKLASDGLKGRVYEVSLADLQNEQVRSVISICYELPCNQWCFHFVGCRKVLQEIQAFVRRSSRQELFDSVLWHELDH